MAKKASKEVEAKEASKPAEKPAKAKPAKAAKKSKTKKAPRKLGTTKTTAAEYRAMAKSGKFNTIGEHFRARIVEGKLDNDAILAQVQKAGSDAKMTSLYWNRKYLKQVDGISLE